MSEKSSPKRIQKKNFYDYSWKSNPNAVYVGRPSRYGNPFKVSDHGLDKALFLYGMWVGHQLSKDPDFLEPLRGKDLVCFCPLDQRCHADVLLKMANEKPVRRWRLWRCIQEGSENHRRVEAREEIAWLDLKGFKAKIWVPRPEHQTSGHTHIVVLCTLEEKVKLGLGEKDG